MIREKEKFPGEIYTVIVSEAKAIGDANFEER